LEIESPSSSNHICLDSDEGLKSKGIMMDCVQKKPHDKIESERDSGARLASFSNNSLLQELTLVLHELQYPSNLTSRPHLLKVVTLGPDI
jgi:hypothetical protein